jgi:hypothetical protein
VQSLFISSSHRATHAFRRHPTSLKFRANHAPFRAVIRYDRWMRAFALRNLSLDGGAVGDLATAVDSWGVPDVRFSLSGQSGWPPV